MFCNKGVDSIVMAEKKKNVFQRTEICKGLQCCILYSSPLPIVPTHPPPPPVFSLQCTKK